MGTFHFLFSDIEGSTKLWDEYPDGMGDALKAHDRAVHEAVNGFDGSVFKHTGDGFAAVFDGAVDALWAAAGVQYALSEIRVVDGVSLSARMAVHSGPAEERDQDYFGPSLNRVARLMAVGHGGQVLCSLASQQLAADMLGGRFSLKRLGAHRLKDLTRAEEIYQLIGDGLEGTFPPLRTPDVVPNNLPVAVAPFVGREAETAQATGLLSDSRLLTLTGVGGAGKTRLAIHLGAALTDSMTGGVWLVELAALTDGSRVLPEIAETLGVDRTPGTPLIESVIEHLDGRRALLIIDNCEHLLDDSAVAVESLLNRLGDLKIIATSRELLGVVGETARGVRSMSLPAAEVDLDEFATYDAIRLFVDRAKAVSASFRLDESNADAVLEVCRRLDGMPLAIELAAARIRSLTVQEIADNLDQRFRLLTGGSRTALPRQQTLAAAIDWSYRLLNESESALFDRLSVFQGGFDLDAVRSICCGEGIDAFDVIELIPALVDKSLVTADTESATARYRLLETIRQFARDRLDENGRGEQVRLRHAEYFLAVSRQVETLNQGDQENVVFAMAETDLDNIRHAMDWSLASARPELAMGTAAALRTFWDHSVRSTEGSNWLKLSLNAVPGVEDTLLRAKANLAAGVLLSYHTAQSEAKSLFDDGISALRDLEPMTKESRTLMIQGLINQSQIYESEHRYAESDANNQEARELARGFDLLSYSVATGNIAETVSIRGDTDAAAELFEESIATADQVGKPSRRFDARWQAANYERAYAGNLARAEQLYTEAIEIGRDRVHSVWASLLTAFRAPVRLALGKPEAFDEFLAAAHACLDTPDFNAYGAQASLLVIRAEFDSAAEDYVGAATILGALQAMRTEGATILEMHDAVIQNLSSQAIDQLGQAAYNEDTGRGQKMTRSQQLALITRP
jgi:predicted ATPase/class 3 adenylate cyclase